MARYVLDDAKALQLASGYSIWEDFPDASGQVYTYEGKCEQYIFSPAHVAFFEDTKRKPG